jgi:hypothetical protein
MGSTFRKLAREAVIFKLSAGVIGAVWLGTMPSNRPDAILTSVIGFVFGLGAGLIAWALYRMVRFAITG